ncbi:MAG: thioredoxin domain-containing protein, partial [Rubrobacteraceae bacterium]
EERPDIDSIYMSALQAMTRGGGWPMTVFLTPDGAPFYAGTYFPLTPRQGMPSFQQVLASLADAYENRRDDVLKSADSVREFLEASTNAAMPKTTLTTELLDAAASSLMSQLDRIHGGFGGAPKFPQAMNLEVLHRHHARTGDEQALAAVELSLLKMAEGGIYDQIGGGFARYSVDERWLVPHFEKMLYDNALLTKIYIETYQATGDVFYRRIAEETLDYVVRDMTSPEGGFYSAEDADSEGVEGKFYVWSVEEIKAALSPEEAKIAIRYWGVTETGNFEGKNILNVAGGEDEPEGIGSIKTKLLEERNKRIRPGLDDKVLAAWNGMMLRSFALAARAFDQEDHLEVARRNAAFLVEKMKFGDRLCRSYKNGEARIDGYLEDYAMVADGLLALYEADFDLRWLKEAISLADTMNDLFWDEERGAFYDTPADHEKLVTRPRDVYDNAAPSGNSVAAEVLLRLALLLGREDYRERAEAVLEDLSGAMEKLPGAFGRSLSALDFHLGRPREVVIAGEPESEGTKVLVDTVYSRYLPNRVFALVAFDDGEAENLIPLLEGKTMLEGQATAYVCENYACQAPTTDAEELSRQLRFVEE